MRTLKLAIATVLFLAAILVFWLTNSSGSGSEAAGLTVAWYCTDCKQGFELPGDALTKLRLPDDPKAGAASGPQPRQGRRGMTVARCPRCSQWTAVAAHKCERCGTIFSARQADGSRAKCPKCSWDPAAPSGKK
jgi:hypothetical protein